MDRSISSPWGRTTSPLFERTNRMSTETSLLSVRGVSRSFPAQRGGGEVTVVDAVSFDLPSDRPMIFAVAGESGSGKSTLASMLLGFLKPSRGTIAFEGTDIGTFSRKGRADYRRRVQAVFQDPFDAFNPFYAVEHVLQTAISKFRLADTRQDRGRLIEDALSSVRLNPKATMGRHPHQLSGGQLQRVMIARALLIRPKLIVADEPVSMIDASLRAIVLDIMARLRDEHRISQVYITHDLSSALQISDRILILYRGMVVESGPVEVVIQRPKHPYTQLLIASIPVPDPDQKWHVPLEPAQVGEAADIDVTHGCKFRDRCPHRMTVCDAVRPPDFLVGPDQRAACHLYDGHSQGATPGLTLSTSHEA